MHSWSQAAWWFASKTAKLVSVSLPSEVALRNTAWRDELLRSHISRSEDVDMATDDGTTVTDRSGL